jgi:hypothetical protein
MIIKAVSIKQPWAGLIAAELKWIETRKWSPVMGGKPYVGALLVVSSLKPDKRVMGSLDAVSAEAIEPYLLYGQALCLCNLVLARPMTLEDQKGAMCPIYPRAISWVLDDIRPLKEPFPVTGRLGLYDVEVPDHEIM